MPQTNNKNWIYMEIVSWSFRLFFGFEAKIKQELLK